MTEKGEMLAQQGKPTIELVTPRTGRDGELSAVCGPNCLPRCQPSCPPNIFRKPCPPDYRLPPRPPEPPKPN